MTASLEPDPISARVWCFQERLLASRVLHFTKSEIVWECKACQDCECGRETYYRDPQEPSFDHLRGFIQNFHAVLQASLSTRSVSHSWEQIATAYSYRKLTADTDRLPAMTGIAKRFASRHLGDFLAGLWRQDLPGALLWCRAFRTVGTHPSSYVAPSWSWLGTLGGVTLRSNNQDMVYLVKVISGHSQPAGKEPFGQISHGSITLMGPVVRGTLQCDDGPAFLPNVFLDVGNPNAEDNGIHSTLDVESDWEPSGTSYLVLCVIFTREKQPGCEPDRCEFLVLQELSDSGQYRRVGATASIKLLSFKPGLSL